MASEPTPTTRPLYDSRALALAAWQSVFLAMLAFGWEYKRVGDVVYARKHRSGPRNETDSGWLP